MSLEYNKNLIPRAKELRKNATPQEKELWYKFLSTYPVRFQRQKTIGHYIVDFYCHAARLIIELDGFQHFTPEGKAHDKVRSETLSGLNLKVLRFTNNDIDHRFSAVCQQIDDAVHERL